MYILVESSEMSAVLYCTGESSQMSIVHSSEESSQMPTVYSSGESSHTNSLNPKFEIVSICALLLRKTITILPNRTNFVTFSHKNRNQEFISSLLVLERHLFVCVSVVCCPQFVRVATNSDSCKGFFTRYNINLQLSPQLTLALLWINSST